MKFCVNPARKVTGFVRPPGDKSISHRYAMLASIAEGVSRIANYSTGADCQSTLSCMEALGIQVTRTEGVTEVHGQGLRGLQAPTQTLDAGNSGSTVRMLSGILAAQPFVSRIEGDESLSKRPMERIMNPLAQMGATIQARDGRYPPLEIHGGPLQAIDYTLPVASAQVKSCVLLAGLYADGVTTVRESIVTRDHTELALREFGVDIECRKGAISVDGNSRLTGTELVVPGDLSSAAFFLVAALLFPDSDLLIQAVGLNPTRSALIDFLVSMGARIQVLNLRQAGGELIGDLRVSGSVIQGGTIQGATTAAVIDEIPVLAVLGAMSAEGLVVKDAAELRVKETDRIATVVDNFARLGVTVEDWPDGFRVPGKQKFRAAQVDSFGDHRIAMAFAVAGLAADGAVTVQNAEAASVSFPEFYDALSSIAS